MTRKSPADEQAATTAALAYLSSLDSMEGLSVARASDLASPSLLSRATLHRLYPGILIAGTIGIAATWLSIVYRTPVMLFALLLGMAFHFLHDSAKCKPGIDFSSRTLLRCGVALLGFRITFGQVVSLGPIPLAMVVTIVPVTMLFGIWLAKRLGLGQKFGVLSGGAVAICGASAALAISTTLPAYAQKERDTVLTVVGVTTLSTIAMVTYPILARLLHLDHMQAGIFLGGTIHDVAQVVGAGFTISPETGDVSTYVKLLRVAMLIPVTIAVAFVTKGAGPSQSKAPPVPLFLVGFAAAVLLNSLVNIGEEERDILGSASNWCLVTAISAARHQNVIEGSGERWLETSGADRLGNSLDMRPRADLRARRRQAVEASAVRRYAGRCDVASREKVAD